MRSVIVLFTPAVRCTSCAVIDSAIEPICSRNGSIVSRRSPSEEIAALTSLSIVRVSVVTPLKALRPSSIERSTADSTARSRGHDPTTLAPSLPPTSRSQGGARWRLHRST